MSGGSVKVWKTGDAVRITVKEHTVPGKVLLASGNGKSLALQFEAILAGYVGMMPVLYDDEIGAYRALVCGTRVIVQPAHAVPDSRDAT